MNAILIFAKYALVVSSLVPSSSVRRDSYNRMKSLKASGECSVGSTAAAGMVDSAAAASVAAAAAGVAAADASSGDGSVGSAAATVTAASAASGIGWSGPAAAPPWSFRGLDSSRVPE